MEEISREQKSDSSPFKNAVVKAEDVSFNGKLLETNQILKPQGYADSERTRNFCDIDIMLKRKNKDKLKLAPEVEAKHVNASIENRSSEPSVDAGFKQTGKLDDKNNDFTSTKGKPKTRKSKENKLDADFEQLGKSKGVDNTKTSCKVQFNETQCECTKSSSKNRRSRKEKSKRKSNTDASSILKKADVLETNDPKLGKIIINKLETEVAATVISSDSTIFVKRFNNSDFSLDLLNFTKHKTKNMKIHNNSLDSINFCGVDVNEVKKSVEKVKSRKKAHCFEAPLSSSDDDDRLKLKNIPLDCVKNELEAEVTKTKNKKRKKYVRNMEHAKKEKMNTENESFDKKIDKNDAGKTLNKINTNQSTGNVKQQTNEREGSVVKLFVIEKMPPSNSCTVLLDDLCDNKPKPIVSTQGNNVEMPLQLICKDVATSTCGCKEKVRKRSKSKHKSTKRDKNTQETSELDTNILIGDSNKTNKVIAADKKNKMSKKVRKASESEVIRDKTVSKQEAELNYAQYLNYDTNDKSKLSKRKSPIKQAVTCFENAMGDSYVNFKLPLKSEKVTYKQYQIKEYVKKTKYSRSKSWGAGVQKPEGINSNALPPHSHNKSGHSSDSDLHKNLLLLKRSKTLFKKDIGQMSRKQNVMCGEKLVTVLALQDSEFPKNKTKVIQRTTHSDDVQEEKKESVINLPTVNLHENQEIGTLKNSDNFIRFREGNVPEEGTVVLYNRNKSAKKRSKRKSFRREISISQMNLTPMKDLYKKPSKKSLDPKVAAVTKTQRTCSYFKKFPNWDKTDGCTFPQGSHQKVLEITKCASGIKCTAERKLSVFHMRFEEKVVEISTKEIGDDGRMTVGFIVYGTEPARKLKCKHDDRNKQTLTKTRKLHATLLTPIEIQESIERFEVIENGGEKVVNLEAKTQDSNENKTKPSDVKTGEERGGKLKVMSKKRTSKKSLIPRRIISKPRINKRSKRKSLTETASKKCCNVIALGKKPSVPGPLECGEKQVSLVPNYESSLQVISEEVPSAQKTCSLEQKETQTGRESYDVEKIKQILSYIAKTIEEARRPVHKNEIQTCEQPSSTDTSSYYEQFKKNVRAKFSNMKKGDKSENPSVSCDKLGNERGDDQADQGVGTATSSSNREEGKNVLGSPAPVASIARAEVLCKAYLEKYTGTQELIRSGKTKRDASKTADAGMVTENERSVPENPLDGNPEVLVGDNFGEGFKNGMGTQRDGVADVETAEAGDVCNIDRVCESKSIQVSVGLHGKEDKGEVNGNAVKVDNVTGTILSPPKFDDDVVTGPDFAFEKTQRDFSVKINNPKRSTHFAKLKKVFLDKRGGNTHRKKNNGKECLTCPKAENGDYMSFLKLERHLEQLLGLYPSIFRAIRSHVNDSNAKHVDRQMKKESPDLFPSQTTLATTVDTITEYKNIDCFEQDPCSSQNVNLGSMDDSDRNENLVEDFLKTYNFDLREFSRNRTENGGTARKKVGFDCTIAPSNLSNNFSERLRGILPGANHFLVPDKMMHSLSDSSNQLPENWSTESPFCLKATPTDSSSWNCFAKSVTDTKSAMMAKGCTSDLSRSKSLDEIICCKHVKCGNKCPLVKPRFKETSAKFLLLTLPRCSSKFFENMDEGFGVDKKLNVESVKLRKEPLKCAGYGGEMNDLPRNDEKRKDEEKKFLDELCYRNILFPNRGNVVSTYMNYNSTPSFYINDNVVGFEEVNGNSMKGSKVEDDSAEEFSSDSLETTKSKNKQSSFYVDKFNPTNQTFLIYNSTVEYDKNYNETIGKRDKSKKAVETKVDSVQSKKKLSDVSGNSEGTSGTLLTESGYESNKSKRTNSVRNFFKKGGSLLDAFRSNKKQSKSSKTEIRDETKLTNFTALFAKKKQTELENVKAKKDTSTSTSTTNEGRKVYWHSIGKKPKHGKEASTSNASTSTEPRTKHHFFKNKNTSTDTSSNLKSPRGTASKEYKKQVDECHAYAEKVFLESQMRREGYYKQYNDFKEIPLEHLIGKRIPCCSRMKCVESSSREGSSSEEAARDQAKRNSHLKDKIAKQLNLKAAKSQEPKIVTEDETVKLQPDGVVQPLAVTDSLLLLRLRQNNSKHIELDKVGHTPVVRLCSSIRDIPTEKSQSLNKTQVKTSDSANAKKKTKKVVIKTSSKTKKGCLCRQETTKPKTSRHVTKEVVQAPIVKKTYDGAKEIKEKISKRIYDGAKEIEEKIVKKTHDGAKEIRGKMGETTDDDIEDEIFLKETTFTPHKLDFEGDHVVRTIMSDIVTKAVVEGELFLTDESDDPLFFEKYMLDISPEKLSEDGYVEDIAEEKKPKVRVKMDLARSKDESKKSLTDKEVFDKLLKSYEKTEDIATRISNDEEFFREEIKNIKRGSDESFDDTESGTAAVKRTDLKDIIYTDDIPKTAHRSTHFWEEKIRKMRASEVNPVKTDDIGTCFSRGFRPDNIALSGDACFNLNKQDKLKFTKGMLTNEESIIDFSERETPLDYLLALGFMVDEASNALKDDDIRNRLLAAITEARVWINKITTTQGILLYLVAYKSRPKTMRYFLQLVEAIINKRINNAIKLDGFLRVLEKVEEGEIQMINILGADKFEDEENEEKIVKKQLRELFVNVYKIAEREAAARGKELSQSAVLLLRILAAKYRAGLHPHLELIARYIGQEHLNSEVQLEAAMIFLSRLDTAEVKLKEFEAYCDIKCEKKKKSSHSKSSDEKSVEGK